VLLNLSPAVTKELADACKIKDEICENWFKKRNEEVKSNYGTCELS